MSQQARSQSEAEPLLESSRDLISSRRVEGTPVYNRSDQRLGTIHSVMIEKRSGKVAYAVLSFGGVFGLGEHVHPVPWERLNYDVNLDAYVIDLTREELEAAPTMRLDEADRPQPKDFEEVAGYYAKLPWWGL
jgi:hypothetical protein